MVNSANACVRWLAPQNLERARQSAVRIVADGQRAADTITRIRALAQNAPAQKDWLDLNATIRDVLALVRNEVHRHGVTVETQLAADVPQIRADLPLHFGQATPYNSLVSLLLEGRKSLGVSAYILRQLLGWGKGVPNASRMAF